MFSINVHHRSPAAPVTSSDIACKIGGKLSVLIMLLFPLMLLLSLEHSAVSQGKKYGNDIHQLAVLRY